ncbi:MAG: O-antigen ligase domain-containing protein [Oxalobacter sp.]|nr:MAG: O-antigen ligase domain-containing protein [Oxalobacter sp.]
MQLKLQEVNQPGALFSVRRCKFWLVCAICFVLPMKASYIYILSALLLIFWLVEGDLRGKLNKIIASKLCLACVGYFFVYLVAMFWTQDVKAGWRMVGRQIPFLIFPLYLSCADTEKKECYVSAFIAGLSLCALLAHYNFFQLHWFPDWPRGVRVYKGATDTAPFVDWIMYSPMLALGLYFSIRRVLFDAANTSRIIFGLIACFFASNLSFSGGRAGMIMFAALLLALIFERIRVRIKAVMACFVIIPLLFCTAYYSMDSFAVRVDRGITDIREFEKNPSTSVGFRMVYWTTTFNLFIQNPLLGVGSGDLQLEYAKIKPKKWSMTPDSYNPHNQYLMTAATTGLFGLVTLMYIFYLVAMNGDARTKSVLFGFMVLCLFESYLWRSNTALAFLILVSALIDKAEGEIRK